jgi:hypothetical protein
VRVIYPAAKEALLRGQFDLVTDTIKAQLVGAYTYAADDAITTDLAGTVGSPVIVSVTSVTDGVALCADVIYNNLSGADVTGIVFYQDNTPDPGVLISYTNQRTDTTPVHVVPNGGDVTFTFDFMIKI